MAKKRKKKKPPENLYYEIEVEEWDVYYHFGLAPKSLDDMIRGIYWESSTLTLFGNILKPELKNAKKARVDLSAEPEMSDHWTREPTIKSAKGVGFLKILRASFPCHKLAKTATESSFRRSEKPYIETLCSLKERK